MEAGRVRVLDHGYVKLVFAWGSDKEVIEDARMSTGKGFEGWGPKCRSCGEAFVEYSDGTIRQCTKPTGKEYVDSDRGGHIFNVSGDEKLLRFLYENSHATPFEGSGAKFEVQAPIMVFREWHRHRTVKVFEDEESQIPTSGSSWFADEPVFSFNEMSARYTALPDLNYVPTVDRALANSKTNKQAGTVAGSDELTSEVAAALLEKEREFNASAEQFYQEKLQAGFPKELARTHLGVSRYSRMRASANLRNWLAFLTLRDASNAQREIRAYAETMRDMLAEKFPRTLALWKEGRHP